MSFLSVIFAVLPFIFLLADSGDGVECYNCRSEIDPGCESAIPESKYLTNCSTLKEGPKFIACRKIDQWVDFEVLKQQPIKRVIRQCAIDVDKDRLCYYRAGFGGRMNVCDCLGEKCNSSTLMISSVFTLLTSFVSCFYIQSSVIN